MPRLYFWPEAAKLPFLRIPSENMFKSLWNAYHITKILFPYRKSLSLNTRVMAVFRPEAVLMLFLRMLTKGTGAARRLRVHCSSQRSNARQWRSTQCRCNTSRWSTSAGHCLWCWPVWPSLATVVSTHFKTSSTCYVCRSSTVTSGQHRWTARGTRWITALLVWPLGRFQCWSACWTVWQWDHTSSWQTYTGKDCYHSSTHVWSWFDGECRQCKREVRRLERSSRRLKTTKATAAWYSKRHEYGALLLWKRECFCQAKIKAEKSKPCQLWRSIDALLGRGKTLCLLTLTMRSFIVSLMTK